MAKEEVFRMEQEAEIWEIIVDELPLTVDFFKGSKEVEVKGKKPLTKGEHVQIVEQNEAADGGVRVRIERPVPGWVDTLARGKLTMRRIGELTTFDGMWYSEENMDVLIQVVSTDRGVQALKTASSASNSIPEGQLTWRTGRWPIVGQGPVPSETQFASPGFKQPYWIPGTVNALDKDTLVVTTGGKSGSRSVKETSFTWKRQSSAPLSEQEQEELAELKFVMRKLVLNQEFRAAKRLQNQFSFIKELRYISSPEGKLDAKLARHKLTLRILLQRQEERAATHVQRAFQRKRQVRLRKAHFEQLAAMQRTSVPLDSDLLWMIKNCTSV